MKVAYAALLLCLAPVAELITSFWIPPTTQLETAFHIAAPQVPLNELIRILARKHNIKPAVVKSVMAAESQFSQAALSPKGAVGLMQLMPETAKEMGADPAVPEQNIEAGARYLSWLMTRYGRAKNGLARAIAAYNAGPGNVDRYHGVPPFRETKAYVARVLKFYKRYETQGIDAD
jgi:soluble lytic murein transglycosylase-like protein